MLIVKKLYHLLGTICDRDRNWSLNFTNFGDDCKWSFILDTVTLHGYVSHQKIDKTLTQF